MKIYIAGHTGMVGTALLRRLSRLPGVETVTRTHAELDLRDQAGVEAFFKKERPEQVYLAAAKVGGIAANAARPGDFIRDNLQIQTNVIDAAYRHGCEKLLFLGSSCMYPGLVGQPMREESIFDGPAEPTNAAFTQAKRAGFAMCQAYRRQYGFAAVTVIPANLYGPGDNFDPEQSHVISALLRRFHEAKAADSATVSIWGTGTPIREFMHVDDLAGACIFLMDNYSDAQAINVGTGEEVTMLDLARLIAVTVGYNGGVTVDPSKPDGAPRKLLDSTRISALGWRPRVALADGLGDAYRWFLENIVDKKG